MKKWAEGIMALTEMAILVAFVLCSATWVETQDKTALLWAVVLLIAAFVGVILINKIGGKR